MRRANHKIFHEFRCGTCGKTVVMTVSSELWGWSAVGNSGRIVFCSYKCMREYEQKKGPKHRRVTKQKGV